MTEITVEGLILSAVVVILTTIIFRLLFSRYSSNNGDGVDTGAAGLHPLVPIINPNTSIGSWRYDVFLSFRGEDTRKNFVDHLYSVLDQHGILTYKDDVSLDRGDTISPSLLKAIETSKILVIIFSENYADSPWCLNELSHIMKCRDSETGQTVLPVFYHVEPSDVRKQKGQFGKAFAKAKHKLSKNNKFKVEEWKKLLVDASNIAGFETKHVANGHEAKCIEEIVGFIFKKLSSSDSIEGDENLVGIGIRMEQLKLQLGIGSGGVRMVGIWGLGGAGKTTLATSLYKKFSPNFDGCCILENIRVETQKHGLKVLQEKILSTVFGKQMPVQSVDLGKDEIKKMLRNRKVLIVLDDVNHPDQLKALAGCPKWFGDGSRIIITSRDEHLLTSTEVWPISLLSHEEAVTLFNKHAYNKNKPIEGYEVLSQEVVTYAAGLPLALIVLGSFLSDKDNAEWRGTLDRLKYHPEMDILEKLKISYDGLKDVDKKLFLDIACFYRGHEKHIAKDQLDACGFYPAIGVKVLIQKALITVSEYGRFDMHDLVQEMAHYIVRGQHPNNPETYSRVWRNKDIKYLCSSNEIMENDKIEAIMCDVGGGSFNNFINVVSNMKKLRSLEVSRRYIDMNSYPASPFPERFQPRLLCFFKMYGSYQKELWKGYKDLPCLKVMQLRDMEALVRTPDFGGLPSLQKLILRRCDSLEEIHQSLGSLSSLVHLSVSQCKKLTRFPKIVKMEKLKILKIAYCETLTEFPDIEAKMDSLVELTLRGLGIEIMFSIIRRCSYLHNFELKGCRQFEKLPKGIFNENLDGLGLRKLNLNCCRLKDGDIPNEIAGLSNLRELHVDGNDFTRLDFSLSRLTSLKVLNLNGCRNLVELPELPSSLAILTAKGCGSLEVIKDDAYRRCKWLCQVAITNDIEFISGGGRLLESMLQGKGDKSGCMLLGLNNIEIQKGFEPPLVMGRTCRMQFPENWSNHFSGFLICYTTSYEFMSGPTIIRMKHVEKLVDDDDDDDDDDLFTWVDSRTFTWVGYIPFNLLEQTSWWDPKSTAVEVEFQRTFKLPIKKCGLKLVPKGAAAECGSSETTPTTHSSSSSGDEDYNPKFDILHDFPWCLNELLHIMKCRDSETGQTVLPVFYNAEHSYVRKQKGQFGKAFAKAKHKLTKNNNFKFESWKKSLVDASNIAGLETKHVAFGC